jgi:hypothetical protein
MTNPFGYDLNQSRYFLYGFMSNILKRITQRTWRQHGEPQRKKFFEVSFLNI